MEPHEAGCRVKVHLRMRPSSKLSPAIHIDEANGTVRIDVQKHHGGGPPKNYSDQMVFSLDNIIQTNNQETVFELCARQVVEDVLGGYNGTILAYGQTGSGKTLTMTGDTKVYAQRGIVPRAVHRIFEEKEMKPESGITVHMSYLEVYNEGIYDLLPRKTGAPAGCLMAMEENGLVEIKGLTKVAVANEEETLKLFLEGEKNRSVAPHTLNQDVTVAKLNLVDLAGSERLKRTDVGGQTKKEAMSINKSLTFLEQAVYALRQGQGHVPFRQSRLTTLLKDALGGNCKTVLIVCAWPEDYFLDETISTLRFAQRVKFLKTSAVINKKMDHASNERRYVREISDLKQELALRDALTGRANICYDELTEEMRAELRDRIQAFLSDEGEIDNIPIENFKQVKELFCLFKEAQLSLRAELEKLLQDYGGDPETKERGQLEGFGVGEDKAQDLHVGTAPPDARPDSPEMAAGLNPQFKQCNLSMVDYKENETPIGSWECDSELRNEAFVEFRHSTAEGKERESMLTSKHSEHGYELPQSGVDSSKKRCARDICACVNEAKQEIQEIKGAGRISTLQNIDSTPDVQKLLEEGTADRNGRPDSAGMDEILDNSKMQITNRFKVVKSAYQKAFNELKDVKGNLETLQQEVRECKQKLLESFYKWFDTVSMYKTGEDTDRLATERFMASVS